MKKEVIKKKNEENPHLIILLKDEKKSKLVDSKKNLEKKLKTEKQKSSLNFDYLKSNGEYIENNSTPTIKTFEFTKTFDTNPDKLISEFNYLQKSEIFEFPEKKSSNTYEISSTYSFAPKIKEEKEDEVEMQKVGQLSKDSFYLPYNFDEEASEEQQ